MNNHDMCQTWWSVQHVDPSGWVSAGAVVAKLRHGPVEQGYELRGGPWAGTEPILMGKADESTKIGQKHVNKGMFYIMQII